KALPRKPPPNDFGAVISIVNSRYQLTAMASLFIKNMVCNRCIMAVQNELDRLGLTAENIGLGEVTLDSEPTAEEKTKLEDALNRLGFELIDDKKSRIIEKIKNVIIDLVHHQDNDLKTNLSDV